MGQCPAWAGRHSSYPPLYLSLLKELNPSSWTSCASPLTSTQKTLRNCYSVSLAICEPVEFRCPQEGVERFLQPDRISRLTTRTFCFGWSPSIRLRLFFMAKCEFNVSGLPSVSVSLTHRHLSLYAMAWLLCIHVWFLRGNRMVGHWRT